MIQPVTRIVTVVFLMMSTPFSRAVSDDIVPAKVAPTPNELERQLILKEREQRLARYLNWLPFGTETIIAAQGPFKVRTNDPQGDTASLAETLERSALG